VIDLISPRLLKMVQRSWGSRLEKGNAPFKFAPERGTKFFEPLGWREVEYRSAMEEGHRLKREMRGAWLWRLLGKLASKRGQAEARRMSGTVLLERLP
jgi:hypothetical protein